MLTVKSLIGPHGPIIDLSICVSTPRAEQIRRLGHKVPDPVMVHALIDTGADCTLIDGQIALDLRISATSRTIVRCLDTPTNEETRPVFDVDVVFVSGGKTSTKFTVPVAQHSFGSLPYQVLLGRDLLNYSTFYYDGPAEEIALSI